MLTVERLHAGYGPVRVLQGITVQVAASEVVAMLGRNGMGKTTLVHTIMGFLRPTGGAVAVNGQQIGGEPPERIWRRGVTLMPQGHRVFGSLSVGENLTVAYRRRNPDTDWTVEEVIDKLPKLGDRWRQRASSLSGGEQQMLTLARTLIGNGDVVLLDEPAEGLAPAITEVFGALITELRRRGRAVLLIEQRYDFATALADRVYVISRGIEVFEGRPDELRADAEVRQRYLGL